MRGPIEAWRRQDNMSKRHTFVLGALLLLINTAAVLAWFGIWFAVDRQTPGVVWGLQALGAFFLWAANFAGDRWPD